MVYEGQKNNGQNLQYFNPHISEPVGNRQIISRLSMTMRLSTEGVNIGLKPENRDHHIGFHK